MLALVRSIVLEGLVAQPIEVEVDVANGLPAFDLVGLPATAVREARERVRSAIRNSGFDFPLRRITVNLAPANVRKEGSGLDVPIALGILAATGQLDNRCLHGWYFVGELALDGSIRQIGGVLAMAWGLSRQNGEKDQVRLLVPEDNVGEASRITKISVFGGKNLRHVVDGLSNSSITQPTLGSENFFEGVEPSPIYLSDLAKIKGQQLAKRALEIAAAGGHNLIMVGPPGTGKTMLARSIPSILPPMTEEESLEATMIHSVAGTLPSRVSWVSARPFRTPHHHTTLGALVGGGRPQRPGEISLAHHGVLFMDEWPEFSREALEALRQPLEDGEVTISRVGGTVTFPARFMLIGAMNPCPCGFLGDEEKECRCTPPAIEKYRNRISGPLWDRMDLQVTVLRPKYEIFRQDGNDEESSEQVRYRVMEARERQLRRLQLLRAPLRAYCNAHLDVETLKQTCSMAPEAENMLRQAYRYLGMSGRGLHRTIKAARTIADLRGSDKIISMDVAEALQYRL